jgi:hypothetical protein
MWASKHFLKVHKSQIRKFLGSCRPCKSANFSGMPVRRKQISNFIINPLIANQQISRKYCTTLSQIIPKIRPFTSLFYYVHILIRAYYALFVRRKCMCIQSCGSLKSVNYKKDCVRKSQIRKVSHLRNVHKFINLFKSANLRICDFQNLFVDRPPLLPIWQGEKIDKISRTLVKALASKIRRDYNSLER